LNDQDRLERTEKQLSTYRFVESYFYDDAGNTLGRMPEMYSNSASQSGSISAGFIENQYGMEDLTPGVYAYNERNQLVAASIRDNEAANTYNADGYRASKTSEGVTTYYTYEYDKVIKESYSNGGAAYNTYGANLISREAGGQKVYYLYNGHGDVTALLSSTGTVLAGYYYDAFGNITEQNGAISNPYRYAGYIYDEDSKLYNLNARFYDAKIARFMQEDTYLGNRRDPLSLNLYTYCVNNPLRYHDPNGHASVPVTTSAGKTVYIKDTDVGAYVMNGKSGSAAVIQPGQTANTVNFKGDVINLGIIGTENIGDNTFYNYGKTTTVNVDNGTINNYNYVGTVNTDGNATINNNTSGRIDTINAGNITSSNSVNVNNSGSIGGIYSDGLNNNLTVYNTGGTIELIESGNSNLLVVKDGGVINHVIAYSDNDNDSDSEKMISVRYNSYAPGASILSISSDRDTAQSRAYEALRVAGASKSTACIVKSGNLFDYTGINPFYDNHVGRGRVIPGIVYAIASTDSERLSTDQQEANANYIYKYLLREGWTTEAICGLLGNIQHESWLNPGVWYEKNETKLAYGLVQWNPTSKFLDWAGLNDANADRIANSYPKSLVNLQLEFLIESCQPVQGTEWLQGSAVSRYHSPYRMSFDDFITSTNNPGDLAKVFHGHYERSGDSLDYIQNTRAKYAGDWYTYFTQQK
ncbi:MAG: phage tail tip lysozyme, partial [Synergistaceae bacterium]|nr:phage tail tip lysozyme [Synergistaceae bacterium]